MKFFEPVLGTASANPDLHREFIASHAPDAMTQEEEVAAIGVEAAMNKATTVFPRMPDGTPFAWDYQVKGFMKDSCGMLSRVPGSESSKLKAWRKIIDGLIFVNPRRIPFILPKDGSITITTRPLRASTPQGERVALASSETIPAGSTMEFEVVVMDERLTKVVVSWFEYGALRGFGQWRNSGAGRFDVEFVDQ